jgi:diguanylate cyclase (GGDEF)-like protein/PAS domain S-box-containing protein
MMNVRARNEGKRVSIWEREAEQFRSLVANVPGIVYRSECHEPWRMFFISDYVETLLGYRPRDFLDGGSVTFGDLLHSDDRTRINAILDDVLEGAEPSYSIEYRLVKADGSVIWVQEHGRVIREGDGRPRWLDGVIFDVSQRKAVEEARDRADAELRHQARHDPLTGLPNRSVVLDLVKQVVSSDGMPRTDVAVLFIDLDHFKQVNDELGHQAGDELLQNVAERLFSTVRATDTIGRLGGDEFIVVLEGESVSDRAVDVATRVEQALAQPFVLHDHPDHPLSISASIGIALGGGLFADEILNDADIALYKAKEIARGSHTVFTPGMRRPGQ